MTSGKREAASRDLGITTARGCQVLKCAAMGRTSRAMEEAICSPRRQRACQGIAALLLSPDDHSGIAPRVGLISLARCV